jgi:hypothetical protein
MKEQNKPTILLTSDHNLGSEHRILDSTKHPEDENFLLAHSKTSHLLLLPHPFKAQGQAIRLQL